MPTRPKSYRRPPGRPPKHGGRALARYLRRNLLDRRSWVSRESEAIQEALAGDEGGLERLSAAQASLLPVLASEALVLGAGWNEVLKRLADGKAVEDLGVTKWLLTLANTYQRHLSAFRELRGSRQDEPLDLAAYLAGRTTTATGDVSPGLKDEPAPASAAPTTDHTTHAADHAEAATGAPVSRDGDTDHEDVTASPAAPTSAEETER